MEQNEANDRVTKQPTPAGQPITTDTVFEIFASLVPDSPWAKRLLKIKTIFNHLATGATMVTTVPGWNLGDQVYDVREREGKGWEGPGVTQFSKGVTELMAGLQAMGAQPVETPEPLPELDEEIDVTAILQTVGAVIREDKPEDGSNVQPVANISLTAPQLSLFLIEYRRQLIEGE